MRNEKLKKNAQFDTKNVMCEVKSVIHLFVL